MPELLSICIPTYNRAPYLRELLDGLMRELEQSAAASEDVKIYISDNASTDSTRDVIAFCLDQAPILYHRNAQNIGGDANFAQMISRASGTYFWLLGDDEWIVPGFLNPLLEILRPATHHLVLVEALTEKGGRFSESQADDIDTFPDYAAFVAHYQQHYPWKLMEHSFISTMVIKHSVYDQEAGRQALQTVDLHYSHMYGLVEGLIQQPGSVYLHRVPTIRIRNRRAQVDTSILELTNLWKRYYRWLGLKFGYPSLVRYGRGLLSWRQRWNLFRERWKTARGRGPRLDR